MESQIQKDMKNYLEHFYIPKITAYEFLKCFFAFLKKKGINETDRDISDFLFEQKKQQKNEEVLKDIKFRTNGIHWYSNDVEDALFNLQNGGLLGKMNPSFGVILIKYSNEEVEKIISSTPEDCIPFIGSIAEVYAKEVKSRE